MLPFNPNATTLEIFKGDAVVLVTSLAVFTDKCGDNNCDYSENHVNCEKDCRIESDKFCQSETCDPNCPDYKDCYNGTKARIILCLFFNNCSIDIDSYCYN